MSSKLENFLSELSPWFSMNVLILSSLLETVNSTIGCSLVASKITCPIPTAKLNIFRPPITHVQAGLRSFDREMPEEINRVLTDVVSVFLFMTERSAERNFRKEAISKEKVHFVDNRMVDLLLKHKKKSTESVILGRLDLSQDYGDGLFSSLGPVTSEYRHIKVLRGPMV